MTVEQAIFGRRSVRKYLDEKVNEEHLQLIMKAGSYAPSGMNNQDRRFTCITNKNILDRINNIVLNNCDEETKQRILSRCNGRFDCMYNTPAFIIVTNSKTAIRPIEDGAVALENMFLMAYELGYGSCWINQLTDLSDCNDMRQLLNEFGIPSNHRIVGCCCIGKTDVMPQLSKQKTNIINLIK